jgi:predicted NBD/HSP70 family sugar kinase
MFYLGLDLGKKHDHTAIVIVERSGEELLVRHLERVGLGTPYTAVVARILEIVRRIGQCAVVVDGTGVGEPVVDALRRAGLGCELRGGVKDFV